MANVITIDGPTSSGKSSVGYYFSQKIGYQFIDTGAIYRAGCLEILHKGIPLEDKEKVIEVFKNLRVKFEPMDSKHHVYLNDSDVTSLLHIPEVTRIVPIVAAMSKVREQAKKIQRRIGESKDTVMTGRDIGSEIFPEAKLKFFITASVAVRAQRRFEQIKKQDPNISFREVLDQMLERDRQDSQREASPMRVPEGAVVVDTTSKTVEESVSELLKHYTARYHHSR